MNKLIIKTIMLLIACVFISTAGTVAADPAKTGISTYTSYPIFQTSAVQPNIMVLLDNSGSMNFAAYGTDPEYGGGLVSDDSYGGEGYSSANRTTIQKTIDLSTDDAQELITQVSTGGTVTSTTNSILTNSATVDMGRRTENSGGGGGRRGGGTVTTTTYTWTTGLRFTGMDIPQGATITNAYIRFRAYNGPYLEKATLNIIGLVDNADDNPDTFTSTYGNISGRSTTSSTNQVTWAPGNWPSGSYDNSPSLSAIVQELVNDPDWGDADSEKTIAFRITRSSDAYRSAYSYDTSSASAPTLYVEYETVTDTTSAVRYYGYFNPEYFYKFDSSDNQFEHAYLKIGYSSGTWTVKDLSTGSTTTLNSAAIDSQELWDGNWMNWLTMRRLDILKKVLIGGKATTEADNEIIVSGEDPDQASRYYQKNFTSGAAGVCPYPNNTYFGVRAGYLYVNASYPTNSSYTFSSGATTFKLDILKQPAYDTNDFENGNLVGVLQRIGNRARWGNLVFNPNTSYNGGKVINKVGSDVATVVTSLSDEVGNTSTPLAETFYTGVRHFMQRDVETGTGGVTGYEANCTKYSSSTHEYDPYYFYDSVSGTYTEVPCVKSYVLLLTDGASTNDLMVPTYLKDYDGDGVDVNLLSGNGSHYLDDIAYYAHVNDLRSATLGKSALEGIQNLSLYAVLAFDDDETAVELLKNAAKKGGFIDKNPTTAVGYVPTPDLTAEWDEDNNGIPDTFYKAKDGYVLETELLAAINDILKRAASGTAVSVLATSSEGEGNLIQAYFKPVIPSGLDEIKWGGYIQSLWVDSHGNLREDTNENQTLDVTEDDIISYFTEEETGDTRVKLWHVSEDTPYPDIRTVTRDLELDIDDIKPIWEGAKKLSERTPDSREIFTYLDVGDGIAGNGDVFEFNSDQSSTIMPYLGLRDSSFSYLGTDEELRANNLINYIRGADVSGLRTRTLEGAVWKLGDIIHSTPVSVSKPADNYHIIYGDKSYGEYYKANLNRETVVYVGANDGMLHALTSGVYNSATKEYTMPSGAATFGDELWAYIPQALLPHLKWLADPDYTHVYYCDLKPKVFDAKIDHDGDGDTEWRTLLLLGLNLGGKEIQATGDFDYDEGAGTADTTETFTSSYSCLDITDPRNPGVLWERSYDDLELTTSFPAVIKVKDKWFAVFGSGPSTYGGTTTKQGHVFVVDLATGAPYQSSTGIDWLFHTTESNAFMNSPVSVDVGLDYSVDAVYFGDAYYDSSQTIPWRGKLYKVVIPWVDGAGNYDGDNTTPNKLNYSDDPLSTATNKKWQFVSLLNAERPVTSSVALSMDQFDNVWIYVGSGRYLDASDKSNTDQQYMFGVKDPFYNKDPTNSTYYHKYTTSREVALTDLFNSDPYLILNNGEVYLDSDSDGLLDYSTEYVSATPYGNWSQLLTAARLEDGWIRSLIISGERIVTKFTILGGIVFTPSFDPDADICGYGGESYLYGQYYETGTAYWDAALDTYEIKIGDVVLVTQMLDKTSIGSGMASSVGVHVGAEGSKGFIQTSSGTIIEQELETATDVKSGLRSWREK